MTEQDRAEQEAAGDGLNAADGLRGFLRFSQRHGDGRNDRRELQRLGPSPPGQTLQRPAEEFPNTFNVCPGTPVSVGWV